VITSGSVGGYDSSSAAFYLPEGFRPDSWQPLLDLTHHNTVGRVDVLADGEVRTTDILALFSICRTTFSCFPSQPLLKISLSKMICNWALFSNASTSMTTFLVDSKGAHGNWKQHMDVVMWLVVSFGQPVFTE
jgi:hypothetical protein